MKIYFSTYWCVLIPVGGIRVQNTCATNLEIFWLSTSLTESNTHELWRVFGSDNGYSNCNSVVDVSHRTDCLRTAFHSPEPAAHWESVSLRCESFRLRAARGRLEEAVLCTSEEECLGLWLSEEQTDRESCICEQFPVANFTPVDRLPLFQIKSIRSAPVRSKEG